MRVFRFLMIAFGVAATLAPTPAAAQSTAFDLRPGLTAHELKEFAGELSTVMRFRQLGDPATLAKGDVDLSLEFASAPDRDTTPPSISFPRVVARFGVSSRVDVGVWGGLNASSDYGVVGFDTTIALLKQDQSRRPVTLSIRPSVTTLVGPSDFWAAHAGIDVSVSRSFGAISPYVGVASIGSLVIERASDINLDPAVYDGSASYAGVSYRWRTLSLSAEVEKSDSVTYGVRLGTRF